MFRKPFADLKTSAPLRSSDRKKFRQRVLSEFGINTEDGKNEGVGDLLVPDGLQSVKIRAHAGEPGLVYLSPDGDPLWFTDGKADSELVPTVYTLWKRPSLLPSLSTGSTVIEVLMGGADLMAPGVMTYPWDVKASRLVSIAQYDPSTREGGMPLAVARVAVDASALEQRSERKGKAAIVLHMHDDYLWKMGKGGEIPDLPAEEQENIEDSDDEDDSGAPSSGRASRSPATDAKNGVATKLEAASEGTEEVDEVTSPPLKPEDVSSILHSALLQAIRTSLSSLPSSSFPLSSSVFYSAHLLPARPARLPAPFPPQSSTPIDIKHSSHKSLTHFLRASEKQGLLSLKETKNELLVTSVYSETDIVKAHVLYKTVKEEDAKAAKREAREEKEKAIKEKSEREIKVVEMWRPHINPAKQIFEECKSDTSALYTFSEVKTVLNDYISAKSLTNTNHRNFVNVSADDLLCSVFYVKRSIPPPEFAKREEIVEKLTSKMQPWHRLDTKDKRGNPTKGELKRISVIAKLRQGRKACTLITGFESFLLVAENLSEELRKRCASATSVSPLPGKTSISEVMVQGIQIKAVTELLAEKGISNKWIESEDQTKNKK